MRLLAGYSRRIESFLALARKWRPGLLAIAVFVVYSRTFSVPLLFDDQDAIANNPSLRQVSALLRPPSGTTAGGRPFLNLSFALNYGLGGTSVEGYHIVNLAIHIFAALTLFGVLRRTLVGIAPEKSEMVAFGASLLWALHPVQTESVTYIAQRAESLMGLLYLLTLYGFIRYTESRGPGWAVGSILACFCGMATKEVMASAPLLLFCYDRVFVSGSFSRAFRARRRFYGWLAGSWLLLALLVFSAHGRGGSAGFGGKATAGEYWLAQFPIIARYLRLSIWPHPLIFYYGFFYHTPSWTVVASAVLVLGLSASSIWAFFRTNVKARALGFLGLWFFMILAPSSLVPIYKEVAAEHRMYLPLISLATCAVVGCTLIFHRAASTIIFLAAAALGWATLIRNQDYRSAVSIWVQVVSDLPSNAYAHYNLGCVLDELPNRATDAIVELKKAIALEPNFPEAHNNLAVALVRIGRADDAVPEHLEAIRLRPVNPEFHNDLGIALAKMGRPQQAIDQYREALRLAPDFSVANSNLGNALCASGRAWEAISHYRKALRTAGDDPVIHFNLGNALADCGQGDAAESEYIAAIRLDPVYGEARDNLANILIGKGRIREAIEEYRIALRTNSRNARAQNNLGYALQKTSGGLSEAIDHYQAAVQLDPGFTDARFNLANALSLIGRKAEAVAEYERALNQLPNDSVIHFNLAVTLAEIPERIPEAEGQLETVVRLQPGNTAAKDLLRRLQQTRK